MLMTDREDRKSEKQKKKQNYRTDNCLCAANPPGTFNVSAFRMDVISIT